MWLCTPPSDSNPAKCSRPPVRFTFASSSSNAAVGGKFARLHRHVDAGHILIHDASGPDIEVPPLPNCPYPAGSPTARPEASMRVAPGRR